MRFIVAFCALLSCCSAACAERIQIVGVVANYVTARDAVDIEIWLDRPLDVGQDWISFTGGTPVILGGTTRPGAIFGFSNGTRWWDDVRPTFDLKTTLFTGTFANPVRQPTVTTPDIAVVMREASRNGEMRHVVSASFTSDQINLDLMRLDPAYQFLFTVNVYTPAGNGGFWGDNATDYSTIDDAIPTHAPEPSSVALIVLGVVGLLGHRLVRRPRLRRN